MRYPSVAEALEAAGALLAVDPRALATEHTVRLLDSALHAPQATWNGEDLVPGLPAKTATLVVHVARNHPLHDGNKRLAWVLMNLLAEMNNHTVHRDVARAICLMWSVAAGEAGEDEVALVVSQWVRPTKLMTV
ncbi:MAG: hypothetical protein RL383_994 [Actinomycetota bacterium]|jgi:death-on-curing protein